jgi:hypothetical protein
MGRSTETERIELHKNCPGYDVNSMLMGGGEIIHFAGSRVVYPFLPLPFIFFGGYFEDSPKWVAIGIL